MDPAKNKHKNTNIKTKIVIADTKIVLIVFY